MFSIHIIVHKADRAFLVFMLKASLMPYNCMSTYNCQVSGFYFLSKGDSIITQPHSVSEFCFYFLSCSFNLFHCCCISFQSMENFCFLNHLFCSQTLRASLEMSAGLSGNVFGPTVYLQGLYGISPCSVFVRHFKAKLSAVP